jgi:hypothetical protein
MATHRSTDSFVIDCSHDAARSFFFVGSLMCVAGRLVCSPVCSWNDPLIAATNLGKPLPNKPIEVVLQQEARAISRQFTQTAGQNGQSSRAAAKSSAADRVMQRSRRMHRVTNLSGSPLCVRTLVSHCWSMMFLLSLLCRSIFLGDDSIRRGTKVACRPVCEVSLCVESRRYDELRRLEPVFDRDRIGDDG